jgi:type VI secretion system ImpA family protein
MDSLANRDFSFDTSSLLIPILDRQPSGDSLRYDAIYDQIREARREDDPAEERGVWKMTLKKADWPAVEKLCIDTLSKRSKDLQIAAWLVEAWLRLYGLPGVTAGFVVLEALSSQFWDTIHPLPDEGDMEYRVAPFEWANEKLPVLLKLVPISNPKGDKSRPMTLADWDNSRRPKPQEEYSRREPDPAQITPELFQESVTLTTTPDLTALLGIVDAAISALSKLDATLDAKCGSHAPGLGQISAVLVSIRGLVHSARVQRPEPLKTNDQESPMSSALEEGNSGDGGGPIRTRVEAYRRLTEAADFLARTEPHSPVPYLVRRAIGWGSMTLDDLLPQLVRNNSELSEIYRLLQIGRMEME